MTHNRNVRRAARQLYRLCLVDGVLDEGRVRKVAGHLASSRYRRSLATLSGFRRLVRLDSERHTALIESATPLVPTLREQLRVDLGRRYGAGVATSFVENPSLIAGLRIRVGSDVYDGSIRARLAALEAGL